MKTVLNVKIDKTTKHEAAKLAEKMGISLSGVVASFLRTFIQTQELHITAAPRMTPYLEKVAEQARKDFSAGVNISGPYETAKDIEKHLKKLMR